MVYLPFLNLTDGTEAQMQFGLDFPILEKTYATLKGWTKKVETGYTFGTELNNLPEIRFSENLYYFPLYDRRNFKVDDTSIKEAATQYLSVFEKYAVPFFEKYRHLQSVERQLNKLPITYPVITNWTDKHIVFGLLLASVFSSENYNAIRSSYIDYLQTMHNSSELSQLLHDTDQFVKRTDVRSLLRI